MSYFPFFTDIQGREGLIIGGGNVAVRKAKTLLSYGAEITIVAPAVSDECRALKARILERGFCLEDISDRLAFVIAAADDRDVNLQAANLCKVKHIPINVVNSPEDGTFVFPALINQGNLSIGVCTSGASPTAAAWLRDRISETIPDSFDDILVWLAEERDWLIKNEPDKKERSKLLKQLFYASIEKGGKLTEEEYRRIKP